MVKLDEETKNDLEILQALNEAIEKGPWEHSGFFRAIGKKLVEIRDRFRNELQLEVVEQTGMTASEVSRIAGRAGLMEVFILLYNAEGSAINRWEHAIQSLKSKMINRPIYRDESLAKAALRGASNKQNEGYIAVYVDSKDIIQLPPEKIPHDRWSNELLLLNERAVKIPNITHFTHVSGIYEVDNGKLILHGKPDFL